MARPRQTHCKRGHAYIKNSRIHNGGHDCRICANANAKIRYNASPELRAKMLACNKRNKIAVIAARVKLNKTHRQAPPSVWHDRMTVCGRRIREGSRIITSPIGQPFNCTKCRQILTAHLKNPHAPILNKFLPLHD